MYPRPQVAQFHIVPYPAFDAAWGIPVIATQRGIDCTRKGVALGVGA